MLNSTETAYPIWKITLGSILHGSPINHDSPISLVEKLVQKEILTIDNAFSKM